MANYRKVIFRYTRHLLTAYASSEFVKFRNGKQNGMTHVVHIRQLRKYLKENTFKLPNDIEPTAFVKWIEETQVWNDEDYTYIGYKPDAYHSTFLHDIVEEEAAPSSKYAAILEDPLLDEHLQGIFYCYQNNLFHLPCCINNPSDVTIVKIQELEAQCPNVSVVYEPDHIILL